MVKKMYQDVPAFYVDRTPDEMIKTNNGFRKIKRHQRKGKSSPGISHHFHRQASGDLWCLAGDGERQLQLFVQGFLSISVYLKKKIKVGGVTLFNKNFLFSFINQNLWHDKGRI